MHQYTITEIAATYQMTLRSLRFYEQAGILTPARVGNRRLYSSTDKIRLEVILKGKQLGFTLTEIKKLIEGMAVAKLVTETPKANELLALLSNDEIKRRIKQLEVEREELQDAINELERVRKSAVFREEA